MVQVFLLLGLNIFHVFHTIADFEQDMLAGKVTWRLFFVKIINDFLQKSFMMILDKVPNTPLKMKVKT